MLMMTDARTLSTEQQALLRQQAITFYKKGKTSQEIRALLDVHPDTVGRWYKRYQEGNKVLIIGKNKPRSLTETQDQRVIKFIRDNMPDQFKLGFALWTRQKKTCSCMLTLKIRPTRVKSYFNSQHIKYVA